MVSRDVPSQASEKGFVLASISISGLARRFGRAVYHADRKRTGARELPPQPVEWRRRTVWNKSSWRRSRSSKRDFLRGLSGSAKSSLSAFHGAHSRQEGMRFADRGIFPYRLRRA